MLSALGGARAVSLSQVCFFAVASLKSRRMLLLDLRGTQVSGLGLPESLLQRAFMSLGLEARGGPVRKPGAILVPRGETKTQYDEQSSRSLGVSGMGRRLDPGNSDAGSRVSGVGSAAHLLKVRTPKNGENLDAFLMFYYFI